MRVEKTENLNSMQNTCGSQLGQEKDEGYATWSPGGACVVAPSEWGRSTGCNVFNKLRISRGRFNIIRIMAIVNLGKV